MEGDDPRAHELLQMIKPHYVEAAGICIEAALHEVDVKLQQDLCSAARLGLSLARTDASSEAIVDAIKQLHVLNAVRDRTIGMPLTITQLELLAWSIITTLVLLTLAFRYNALGFENLIGVLSRRNHHFVAARLCQLMKVSLHSVLTDWACRKVHSRPRPNDNAELQ